MTKAREKLRGRRVKNMQVIEDILELLRARGDQVDDLLEELHAPSTPGTASDPEGSRIEGDCDNEGEAALLGFIPFKEQRATMKTVELLARASGIVFKGCTSAAAAAGTPECSPRDRVPLAELQVLPSPLRSPSHRSWGAVPAARERAAGPAAGRGGATPPMPLLGAQGSAEAAPELSHRSSVEEPAGEPDAQLLTT